MLFRSLRQTYLSGRQGFTLIELLLVIGIIAILAAIVIVAINPTKQLGDARNAQRRSDVNAILNSAYQYSIDFNGNFPSEVPSISETAPRAICQTVPPTGNIWTPAEKLAAANCIDLHELSGAYLVRLPKDPGLTATATGSRYTLQRLTNGRMTVSAPYAENSATISVTR